ncbi:hypothetical protein MMC20_005609 [Loxospora ochrophaea]|nr:hypothetical protein [Loxospora ochrophaea]
MNWTGGRLQRSRNAGSSLTAVQKSHFAKARAKLNNTPCAGSPIKLSFSGIVKQRQDPRIDRLGQSRLDRNNGSQHVLDEFETTAPLAKRLSSLRPRQASRKRMNSKSPRRERRESSQSPFHASSTKEQTFRRAPKDHEIKDQELRERSVGYLSNRQQTSRLEKEERSTNSQQYMEAKRRELLARMDWTGVAISKPVRMNFPSVQERQQVGKRRRLTDAEREACREMSKRRFQPSYRETDALRRMPRYDNAMDEDISVRIGSGIHGTQRSSQNQHSQGVLTGDNNSSRGAPFNQSSQNQRSHSLSTMDQSPSKSAILKRTRRDSHIQSSQDKYIQSCNSSEGMLFDGNSQSQSGHRQQIQRDDLFNELQFKSESDALESPCSSSHGGSSQKLSQSQMFRLADHKRTQDAISVDTMLLGGSSPSTANSTNGAVYGHNHVRGSAVIYERSGSLLAELPQNSPRTSTVGEADRPQLNFSSSSWKSSFPPVESPKPKQGDMREVQAGSSVIAQGSYEIKLSENPDEETWQGLPEKPDSSVKNNTRDGPSLVGARPSASGTPPALTDNSQGLAPETSRDEKNSPTCTTLDRIGRAEAKVTNDNERRGSVELRNFSSSDCHEVNEERMGNDISVMTEEQSRDENAAWFRFVFGYEITKEDDHETQREDQNLSPNRQQDIGSSMLVQGPSEQGSDDSILLPMGTKQPVMFNNEEMSSDELALSAGSSVFVSSDPTLGTPPGKIVFKRPTPFQGSGSKPTSNTIHLGANLSRGSSRRKGRVSQREHWPKKSWSTLGQTHSDNDDDIED